MFRFSLFRTIRTAGRALPSRPNRRGCRPNLETLEDRSVPAGQIITVGTGVGQVDLPTAISRSNADAANNLTTPADPDTIQYAVGFTPPQLEGAVQNTGNLKIVGNVAIDDFSSLTNTGTLHVTGNLSLGHAGLHRRRHERPQQRGCQHRFRQADRRRRTHHGRRRHHRELGHFVDVGRRPTLVRRGRHLLQRWPEHRRG